MWWQGTAARMRRRCGSWEAKNRTSALKACRSCAYLRLPPVLPEDWKPMWPENRSKALAVASR
jgi:hypothetical protein